MLGGDFGHFMKSFVSVVKDAERTVIQLSRTYSFTSVVQQVLSVTVYYILIYDAVVGLCVVMTYYNSALEKVCCWETVGLIQVILVAVPSLMV